MVGLSVVLLLVVLVQVISGQEIAQQKCAEFRKKTIKVTSIIPLTLNPNPIKYSSFNCSKTVDLIVGGEATKPNEFPHQALLGWRQADDSNEYRFDCGGSLISERYVLTAAHCFKNGYPDIVRLGEHNLNDDSDNQVDFEIESFSKHPLHRYAFSYHDIALVKLAENVRFSKVIRPACLWTGMNLNVSSVIATGFGLLQTAGDSSEVLRKVMLDILDRQECEEMFIDRRFKNGIIDGQLCIGSKRGGKDTCQGDSGGPIQVITEPKGCIYHVIGVTSTGAACGINRSPSIYTRVASYMDWIEDIVWNNGQGQK
ncbi:serine protease snake-like [Ochlerotatus camptorhynchus]|uniref:serine protease snake-like n=1 Tax=Ochlerotatus camptorhynchus TaxID=644619 RepID=UPI0031D4F6D5